MNTPYAPTQVTHPNKTTVRTALQVLVGLAAIVPLVITDLGVPATGGVVVTVLGIAAAVTRIMALPEVDRLLSQFGLGAEPNDERL